MANRCNMGRKTAKNRDLLDGESGAVIKSHHNRITVALVYPNTYPEFNK